MSTLNFTPSLANTSVSERDESDTVQYIRIFNTMPIVWLKAIPIIAYTIGLLANLLLATYLIKCQRYRSPIFALILSMSFADSLMCAIAIVWLVWRIPFLIGPDWLCPFGEEVLYAAIVCSEYHLAVIAIVRFYQLVFPLSARAKLTPELMGKICIGVWILSFTSNSPFAYFVGAVHVRYEARFYGWCIWTGGQHIWDNLYLAIVNVFLQFATTALFHIAKYCIVSKADTMSAKVTTQEEQKHQTTDSRAIMIVITVYLVTSAPITIENIAPIFRHPLGYIIAWIIQWLNSALHPFIYAFAAQSVRRDVLRMVCSGVLVKYS